MPLSSDTCFNTHECMCMRVCRGTCVCMCACVCVCVCVLFLLLISSYYHYYHYYFLFSFSFFRCLRLCRSLHYLRLLCMDAMKGNTIPFSLIACHKKAFTEDIDKQPRGKNGERRKRKKIKA